MKDIKIIMPLFGTPRIRPKKKKVFVSCNGLKINRVGRSVKKNCIIFLVKNVCFMHVLRRLGVGKAEKTSG